MPPQADQQKSSGQGAKKRALRGRTNAAKPSAARSSTDSNNRPRPAVTDDTTPIPRLGQVSRAEAVAAAQAAGGQRSVSSASRPSAAQAAPTAPAQAAPAQAARSVAPAPAPARTRTAPAAAPTSAQAATPAQQARRPQAPAAPEGAPARVPAASGGRPPRRARLRLTRIDPWSVMKTAFLLSIALGIVLIVSVLMIWAVLGAAGLWDSINSTVQSVLGQEESANFDVNDYVGLSRVLGFTVLVAAIDVVLLTAIATLAAFLYNMAAALLGGIELTLAEDRN